MGYSDFATLCPDALAALAAHATIAAVEAVTIATKKTHFHAESSCPALRFVLMWSLTPTVIPS